MKLNIVTLLTFWDGSQSGKKLTTIVPDTHFTTYFFCPLQAPVSLNPLAKGLWSIFSFVTYQKCGNFRVTSFEIQYSVLLTFITYESQYQCYIEFCKLSHIQYKYSCLPICRSLLKFMFSIKKTFAIKDHIIKPSSCPEIQSYRIRSRAAVKSYSNIL